MNIRPINLDDLGDVSLNDEDERQVWIHNTPKAPFTRIKHHKKRCYIYFDNDEQDCNRSTKPSTQQVSKHLRLSLFGDKQWAYPLSG